MANGHTWCSRLIVYLQCYDNNKAETVVNLFSGSVEEFFWPRRVRSDHGMEKVGVARLMLEKFGTDSNPHLTGRPVDNQRIERLWKDVVCYVVDHYRELFYWMEDEAMVDPNKELHLLALQTVFLPRINKSLTDFTAHWNNHPLRTERSLSPTQL